MDQRKYSRLTIPLSIRMKLSQNATQGEGIKVTSRNVSLTGFLLETEVFLEHDTLLLQRGMEPVNLDPFLVSGENDLEFNIKLPPDAKIITAQGKLAWFQLDSRGGSYYFKAGISLNKISAEDGKHWINFIKGIADD
jgi:c-di-GMP-binding flagellar brake protein YcgR